MNKVKRSDSMARETKNNRISKSKNRKQDCFWGYFMIAPLTIGLGVFYIIPFFQNFYNSFLTIGAFNKLSFSGFDNYIKLFKDEVMWKSLFNTFKYVLIIVPLTTFFALIVAVLLNSKIKWKSIFRVLYFLPTITMAAAIGMVWRWLYNSDYGLINYLLKLLGIHGQNWLTDPDIAIFSICIVGIWMGIGYNMVILLAGIQGISTTYYEAASIDGAGPATKFFKITLPLVTPTLFFVIINQFISTFQIFDIAFMMISNESIVLEKTQSIVMYFYRNAFVFSKKGYASAIAVIIFIITMLITVLQFKLQKKWVNYD